ncbi:MAG: ABC transporter permease [Thermoanaerobaculia bacterium]|nr:ABC transporter permease [Thermoanaerobaculia bacterium]
MLRNYLLTAYRVLLRRKFFTFVNLFAVALTLAVLTVVFALLQNFLAPMGEEQRSDHYLAVESATIRTENGSRVWTSSPGYRMIERHFLTLETPDLVAFFTDPSEGTVFVDGRKLSPKVSATDANYWKILDFRFVEGRPISGIDVQEGKLVAVINRSTSERIFSDRDPIGQSFVANGQRFEVIGVVEDVPALRQHAFSEIWVPYTSAPSTSYRQEWLGDFKVLLYAEDPGRLPIIAEEVFGSLAAFVYDDPEEFQVAFAPANTKLEAMARDTLDRRFERDSKAGVFILVMVIAMLGFMLLPSINLINLNVSRILERASEIGVRKAFGASSADLVRQFLVENMVLSVLGGALGFGLGIAFLRVIEETGMIPYADLKIDIPVFLSALLAIFVFGLVSGVYPAYKMAKFNPVHALRGG